LELVVLVIAKSVDKEKNQLLCGHYQQCKWYLIDGWLQYKDL